MAARQNPRNTSQQDFQEAFQEISNIKQDISNINLRQLEVFQPTLVRIEKLVQSIEQKDYLKKSEAQETYALKADVEALKQANARKDKYWFAVASAVIAALVAIAFKLITSGVAR